MDKRRHKFNLHNHRQLLALRQVLRRYILRRKGRRCHYCGKHPPSQELTLDHLLPLSRGGMDSAGNIVPCCRACNLDKGFRTEEEYRSGQRIPRKLSDDPDRIGLSRWEMLEFHNSSLTS